MYVMGADKVPVPMDNETFQLRVPNVAFSVESGGGFPGQVSRSLLCTLGYFKIL